MSRSSATTSSFFHSAMPVESREITAQIEKAIHLWCESVSISCFYQTPLSDLKSFKSFFASFADKKGKEQFLIDHGLATVSAASFFFENVVRSENAGIFNNRVMQSLHLNAVRHDQISSHDIRYFPFLRDAPSYNCSTLFEDSQAIKWFENLDKNKIFCEKSYWVFLKIMLTPDDFIRKIMGECVSDRVVALNASLHFCARKSFLKKTLQKNEKFKAWWEKLSTSDIQLMFNELSPKVDLQKTKSLFQAFSQDMMAVKMEYCFSILKQLINLSVDDIFMEEQLRKAIGLYTPLVGVRDALQHLCESFFQNTELCPGDIVKFIRKMTNILDGFESLPFLINSVKSDKLDIFLREMREGMEHLRRSLIDSADEFEEIDRLEESDGIQLPIQLTRENLVRHFMQWLGKRDDITGELLENKMVLLKIFQQTYADYEKSQNTYMAQTTSALFSVVSFTSSWVSSKVLSAPVFLATTPRHNLDEFADRINELNDYDALVQVISKLLSLQDNTIEPMHTRFVARLIKQFSREFLAKQFVTRMQDNPQLSTELMRILSVPVPDADVMGTVNLFIKEMKARLEEWVVIEPASEKSSEGKSTVLSAAPEKADKIAEFEGLDLSDLRPFNPNELDGDTMQQQDDSFFVNLHAV